MLEYDDIFKLDKKIELLMQQYLNEHFAVTYDTYDTYFVII
jgi:hypothetical protein